MIFALLLLHYAADAQFYMRGHVYGHDNEPLVGALVSVEGTKIRTLTNTSGEYSLTIPDGFENSMVTFEYAGHVPLMVDAANGVSNVTLELSKIKDFEDIYVSTQKRLQTSLSVPIAVTALYNTRLDELNTYQIDEISGYVPGFNAIVQSQNKGGYSIRGVTSDGMESFFQPRISVFLDGVSASRLQSSIIEVYDMERIEVVRGPQGTLFGRGAEIGAVHYISHRPEKELSAQLSLNYGGYNQRGAQGYLNTPISNKFANRLAFSYDHHDGYIKNYDGGTLNGKSTIALRNSLRYLHSDKTTLSLIVDYQYDDTPGVCFKSKRLAPEGGDTSPFTAAYLNRSNKLGVVRHSLGTTLEFEHELNSNLNISNVVGVRYAYADEFFDADGTVLNLINCEEMAKSIQFSEEFRLNWDNRSNLTGFVGAGAMYENCEHSIVAQSDLGEFFPACIAPSIKGSMTDLPVQVSEGVKSGIEGFKQMLLANAPAAYSESISKTIDDANALIYTQVLEAMNAQMDTWYNTTHWISTPDFVGDTKKVVNGVLASAIGTLFEENPTLPQLLGGMTVEQLLSQFSLDDGLVKLQPYSNIALESNYEENQTNYTHNIETDVFADFNWNVVGNLYLTLGVRGTYEKQKSGYYSTSQSMPLLNRSMIYTTSEGETLWASEDYYSWVGRFVVNYMLTKYNNVYLSASKGRRPGVIYYNYNPKELVSLQPEEILSYEAGIKGSIFNNSLSYALAGFYYNWKHFQSTTSHTTEGGSIEYAIDDKGRANCHGVELSMRYSAKRLTLFGDYTYFNGTFADTDEDGEPQTLAGNSFRLSPKYACDLGFNINIPIREKAVLYIRPSYSYKSKIYFEDDNEEEISQDEYGIMNATVGVKFSSRNLSYDFGLWGRNITNTEYIIDAGNAGKLIGFPTFVAGAPANFGVKLSVSFKQHSKDDE